MIKWVTLILVSVLCSVNAQNKTFPLCPNDNVMYYSVIGSGDILISTDRIIQKMDVTYSSTDRNVQYTKAALQLCMFDKNVPGDSDVVTAVNVFTDRFGLVRVVVRYADGTSQTKSMNEIIRRKHELLAQE